MTSVLRLGLCAVVAGAALSCVGCGRGSAATLGATLPPADRSALVAVRDLRNAGKTGPVTLQGTMIEKCSVAACWFRLRDKSGVVKVDVKGAGFTVNDVPLNATVTVSGAVVTEGDETYLAATGMQYR